MRPVDEVREEARKRIRMGTWVKPEPPPRHTVRVVGGKVDCCGTVLERQRELTPTASITLAWEQLREQLIGDYVRHYRSQEESAA